jgi:hypothetical protein
MTYGELGRTPIDILCIKLMASFINISTNQIDSYILVVGEVNAHIQLIQSSREVFALHKTREIPEFPAHTNCMLSTTFLVVLSVSVCQKKMSK